MALGLLAILAAKGLSDILTGPFDAMGSAAASIENSFIDLKCKTAQKYYEFRHPRKNTTTKTRRARSKTGLERPKK